MVDSESEPLNSSEDEYFPGDEEMHADDDFVGMEVTVPYRSPLKELFQKGMSKFWAVEKPVVSIPTTWPEQMNLMFFFWFLFQICMQIQNYPYYWELGTRMV